MYTLSEQEKQTLNGMGLSELDQTIYAVLKDKHSYLKSQKKIEEVYVGSQYVEQIAEKNHCTTNEVEETIKKLRKNGLLNGRSTWSDKIYDYFTVNEVPSQPHLPTLDETPNPLPITNSPLPFENDEVQEYIPTQTKREQEIAMLDYAVERLFKPCKTFKEYMTTVKIMTNGIRKETGFRFDNTDIDKITQLSGISRGLMTEIMKDTANEITQSDVNRMKEKIRLVV